MSSPIAWSDVSDAAQELGGTAITVNFQNVILAVVNGSGLNVNVFGGEDTPKTKMARVLLAAHFATMSLRRGVGGAVASQSEGEVAQSYWNAWIKPRALDLTSYGNMFRALCSGTWARAGLLLSG